ncbi:hypothetical protein [Desmospora profundinema]|uniref:DUF5666 domain-containing protein n=1 Tax=Desmospora profundinema TaxID=1571184 RepID=A0ABU1IIY8_9BACL|nr:hypothetical protein [Desmospora profundinema]MDR6224723.1 hypothetical protein [Desmospora profundinema]
MGKKVGIGLLAMIMMCGTVANPAVGRSIMEKVGPAAEGEPFLLSGTMRYLDIQGGCWILVTKERKRFQLDGTPEQLRLLRRDGARVTVLAEKAPDRYGYCMVGTWVRVIRIIRMETNEIREKERN